MITGIWAARTRGEPITSRALRRTLAKVASYEVAIMCGFLVQHYLIGETMPVVSILGGLVGLTELISVLENVDSIAGTSIFQGVLKRLRSEVDKKSDLGKDQ